MDMHVKLRHLGKTYTVTIHKKDKSYTVDIGNHQTLSIDEVVCSQNAVMFTLHDALHCIHVVREQDTLFVACNGDYYTFELETEKAVSRRRTVAEAGNSVSSPMPGLIVKIPVALGDHVTAGTTLAIVEAMKMQNELRAPGDGVVKKINFKEGDQIDALQPIVELEI
jgi:biotin carboxyl carrier protein